MTKGYPIWLFSLMEPTETKVMDTDTGMGMGTGMGTGMGMVIQETIMSKNKNPIQRGIQ